MDIYVTNSCLQKLECHTLFIAPYHVGAENLKRAFLPNYLINKDQGIPSPSLRERIRHLVAGMLLLIPIVNTFAILLFRSIRLKAIQRVQKQEQEAAIKIQACFRGFRARKAYQIKKSATIKMQKLFRARRSKALGSSIKNLIENVKVKTQTSRWFGWLGKMKKWVFGKNTLAFIKAKTKVDPTLAAGCFVNLQAAFMSLINRKIKNSFYYISLATMCAFNATCRLFAPPGTRELERANQYALGNAQMLSH